MTSYIRSSPPFRLQVHLLEGRRDGVCAYSHMNWTGECISFDRDDLKTASRLPEMQRPGVYVLVGYENDTPEIYIGEALSPAERIATHDTKMLFWERAYVVSGKNLNKTLIVWLERELIERARKVDAATLHNKNGGQRAEDLSLGELADMKIFRAETLRLLPVAGMTAFEDRKSRPSIVPTDVKEDLEGSASDESVASDNGDKDTLIIMTDEENLDSVFLGENHWFYVNVAKARMPRIHYVAAYVMKPVQAITHVAEVDRFEPYEDGYRVVFKNKPQKVRELRARGKLLMRGTRYGRYDRLENAQSIEEFMA